MKNSLNTICLIIFLSVSSSLFTQQGVWQTVQLNPGVLLQDVYFLSDGQHGWAAGGSVS